MPGTLVVIPAFNEAATVASVVASVRGAVAEAEVLVVDDGSEDETGRLAAEAGALVLRLALNVGYGAALQAGYKYAVRRGYDVVGQLDADGQHSGADLPALLARLRGGDADIVIGSRFLDGAGKYRGPRSRSAGIALFRAIASLATRQRITDPTSGFQVMDVRVARFYCTEVYPSDYPDADILITLHRSGFKVREVPVEMRSSTGRSMHDGHRSLYYIYKMTLSIVVSLLRRAAPAD